MLLWCGTPRGFLGVPRFCGALCALQFFRAPFVCAVMASMYIATLARSLVVSSASSTCNVVASSASS